MRAESVQEKRNIYLAGFERSPTNYQPLTPLSFLTRSAIAFPDKLALIDGERRFTYRQFNERCRRLASALYRRGIGEGDTVTVLAPNVAATLEAHYGIPMCGAVLNALNTRLDARTIGFSIRHAETRLALVDGEYCALMREAMQQADLSFPIIIIENGAEQSGEKEDYETFLKSGNPDDALPHISDEWSAITLGYTSGTTGDPKGVVCHHRGAYLNALGNVLAAHLDENSVYLWTLPMFHCNGWSHTWAITAVGGTHVCIRRIDPELIYKLIERERITHMSAAPIVLNMLSAAADGIRRRLEKPVCVLTGGSVPPSTVMANIERIGFTTRHIYGLTESTGPSLICEWPPEWDDFPLEERMRLRRRQGVNLVTIQEAIVADPDTCQEVASDGEQMGEIMLRGNTIMMGYLKNSEATAEAFAGNWFHTGDLAIRHPDGYIEIKDRAKDIIISGGENISSVEIEEVLYRHPAVLEAAVVAKPDEKWGEHPCAFIELKDGKTISIDEITKYCRTNLAGFKIPKSFVFGQLPKTSTGKIQKYILRLEALKNAGRGHSS